MTPLKRIFLLLALGACLATAGCGSDDEKGDPIPADAVAALEGRLSETEARLDNGSEGACKDILNDTMPEVGNIIDSLPDSVDSDVRDALEESFDNLWNLVDERCQELKPDEPAQTETTEPEPETETIEVPTEPTETAPPETEPTTSPEEEELPPDGDGENGGAIPETGNGGGVGATP